MHGASKSGNRLSRRPSIRVIHEIIAFSLLGGAHEQPRLELDPRAGMGSSSDDRCEHIAAVPCARSRTATSRGADPRSCALDRDLRFQRAGSRVTFSVQLNVDGIAITLLRQCRHLCRFLGRHVAVFERGARHLPASEKRQGTKSRGRCAAGSGSPMGNRRRRDGRLGRRRGRCRGIWSCCARF